MLRADLLQKLIKHLTPLLQTHLLHFVGLNLTLGHTGCSDALSNLPPSGTTVGAEYDAFLAVGEGRARVGEDVNDGERVQVTEVGDVYVVPYARAGADDDALAVTEGCAGVGGDLDGDCVEELGENVSRQVGKCLME